MIGFMCFSAPASFAAAVFLAGVGAATLRQKPERKRLAFALIPLFFAAQQAVEGFIWLSMADGAPPGWLAALFLFFAQVFWPTYTPASVLLMEDEPRRRFGLWILLAAGLFVSTSLAVVLVASPYVVTVVHHSLAYHTGHLFEDRLIGLYLVATVAPLLLSRHRYVMGFGGVVLTGSVISHLVFYYAAASVWCFFAALGSVFVYFHIRRRARQVAVEKAKGS